jgi:hypothetical protein
MDSPQTQKAKIITNLAKDIVYWSDKNEEYAEMYTIMLHGITYPKEDNIKKESDEDQNSQQV